jgi:hypothetical protein
LMMFVTMRKFIAYPIFRRIKSHLRNGFNPLILILRDAYTSGVFHLLKDLTILKLIH